MSKRYPDPIPLPDATPEQRREKHPDGSYVYGPGLVSRPDVYVVTTVQDNHESEVEGVWTTFERAVAVLHKRYPEAYDWKSDPLSRSIIATAKLDSGYEYHLIWDISTYELDVSSEPWERCRSRLKDSEL